MLKKQDRQGVRRPADIERKYNFNKQFSETRAAAEEARKIASDISESDKGLSLKVEALGKDVDGVKAQLDLKVETDENGNLKSRVHVSGNEFTVDTDNFKLDENGNVAISGEFETTSENRRRKTQIKGGEIYVEAPYEVYGEGEWQKFPLIHFKGFDGKKYALFVYGYLGEDLSFVYQGTKVEAVEG